MKNDNSIYIGIYGKKDSGRSMFTYLLSKSINWMYMYYNTFVKHNDSPDINYLEKYNEWTNYIINQPNFINKDACNKYVHVMSFADNLKYITSVMIGQEFSYLIDRNNKGKLYIKLDDLSVVKSNSNPGGDYMKIEEFYSRFAKDALKPTFGDDILIKMLSCDLKQFNIYSEPYKFRIFYDIKNDREFNFIKDKENSITINISNSESYINNLYDYNILLENGMENNLVKIWELSKTIITKSKNE